GRGGVRDHAEVAGGAAAGERRVLLHEPLPDRRPVRGEEVLAVRHPGPALRREREARSGRRVRPPRRRAPGEGDAAEHGVRAGRPGAAPGLRRGPGHPPRPAPTGVGEVVRREVTRRTAPRERAEATPAWCLGPLTRGRSPRLVAPPSGTAARRRSAWRHRGPSAAPPGCPRGG